MKKAKIPFSRGLCDLRPKEEVLNQTRKVDTIRLDWSSNLPTGHMASDANSQSQQTLAKIMCQSVFAIPFKMLN
jgi:hypothetical protein